MEKELVKVGMKVKVRDSVFARMGSNMAINVFIVGECHNECFFNLKAYGNDNSFMAHCADFEPYEEPKEGNGTYSTSDPLEIAWMKRMCAENKEEREKAENDLKELLNLPKEAIATKQFDKKNGYTPLEVLDEWQKNGHLAGTNIFNNEPKDVTPYQVKDLEGNVIEEKVVDELNLGQGLVNAVNEFEKNLKENSSAITQEFIESFGFMEGVEGVYTKYIEHGIFSGYQLYLEIDEGCYYTLTIKTKRLDTYEFVFGGFTCTTQSELRFLLTKGRIDCSK